MPPTKPNRKFSLATAILAELEESEEIRSALRDPRESSRASSAVSEVVFRGPADDDDEELGLCAEDLVELVDDEAAAPPVSSRPASPQSSVRPSAPASVRPSAPASVRPSAPASVRPSAPASFRPSAPASVRPSDSPRGAVRKAVDAGMLLGRAPLGSPRAPEVRETVDLESLMTGSRTPQPKQPDADWTYWPPTAIVHADPPRASDERDDEDEAPARVPAALLARGGERGMGRRVAVALGAILAIGGAFAAGSLLNSVEPGSMRSALVAGEPAAATAAEPATAGAQQDEPAPSAAPVRAARSENERRAPRLAATRAAAAQPAAAGTPEATAAEVLVAVPVAPSETQTSLEAEIAPTSDVAPADVPMAGEPGAVAAEGEAGSIAGLGEATLDPGAAVASETPVDPAALVDEPAPAEAAAEEPAPAAAIQAVVSPAPPATIPELPSRADVRRALSGATPALRGCTAHRGTAMMSITMSGSGEVLAANPTGAWASGADRSCVRQAIAGARLPRFRQSQLTVQFPFVL